MAYKDVILADAPIGYWRLGEFGSDAQDASGYGHAAVYSGSGMTFRRPGALYGDPDTEILSDGAANSYFQTAADPSFDLPTVVSIVGWLNGVTFAANLPHILGKASANGAGNYALYVNSAGVPQFAWRQGAADLAISANSSVPTGSWHHIAATADATGVRIYIDGQLDKSDPTPFGPTAYTGGRILLFRRFEGWNLNGALDEVALYNKVLTPAQILAHYKAGLPTTGLSIQAILDATALIAGGVLLRPGVYKGAGGIAGVKIAYSDPPEDKSLNEDGFAHVSFWEGYTKEPMAGDLAVYRHRIRMQLMLSAGRSDLPTAYRLMNVMAPLYETAFCANLQLKGTCTVSNIDSSPGIVEAIYPNRLAIEFILTAIRKEAVTNAV